MSLIRELLEQHYQPTRTPRHDQIFSMYDKLLASPVSVDGETVNFNTWFDRFMKLPLDERRIVTSGISGQLLYLGIANASGHEFGPEGAPKILKPQKETVDLLRAVASNVHVRSLVKRITDFAENVPDDEIENFNEYLLTLQTDKNGQPTIGGSIHDPHGYGFLANFVFSLNNFLTNNL